MMKNQLYIFVILGLLGIEVPATCSGFSFVAHHTSHHGSTNSHTVQSGGSSSSISSHISSLVHSNHGSFISHSVHSSGSSSSASNHASFQPAPYIGQPESFAGPPGDPAAPVSQQREQITRKTVSQLTSHSLIEELVDRIVDKDFRVIAREKIIKCIMSSDSALDLLVDQEEYSDFINWEFSFWECRKNNDKCKPGWNVVPASLIGNNMDFVQGLSMDSVNPNDQDTFFKQKWIMSHMIEVACITANENDLENFQSSLDALAARDISAHEVEYFFDHVKMDEMARSLEQGIHACFSRTGKELVTSHVREAADYFGINCVMYASMNQERDPVNPPSRRASLRTPPTGQSGQFGPPGTK